MWISGKNAKGDADYNRRTVLQCASEVVLQSFDVVFSEISSALDFDKDEDFRSDIFDAMGSAGRNIDCSAAFDDPIPAVDGHAGATDNDHPVFGSVFVFLVT